MDDEFETEPARRVALRILIAKVQNDAHGQDYWLRALTAAGSPALLEACCRLINDMADVWIRGYGQDEAERILLEILHRELGLV